jgi:2,4-didehydro-3-deoxy-L-rhamnonate hydrolase
MRIANLNGRATMIVEDGAIDLAQATNGRFGPSLHALFEEWDEFVDAAPDVAGPSKPFSSSALGPPSPAPRQIFAIGLNYARHAEETGATPPSIPAVFTKFPSSLSGPFDDIVLSGSMVDWEVELVVVIGRTADFVAAADAWSVVAGFTVGQDISNRKVQYDAGAQFSLGKSFRTFAPTGPWLVTPDEFEDPNDLGLRCSIDGEVVQDDSTADMVFDVPHLIEELSKVVTLSPGDLIFTGTPAGVGMARSPQRFLAAGETLTTEIEGIGTMVNKVVAPTN